ncbi:hypothetical protein GGF46_002373 [Coemansia sp. RSA 552]|nr:hypothetical protein GGF46_002373 [Coemansia sp. RSA 552]
MPSSSAGTPEPAAQPPALPPAPPGPACAWGDCTAAVDSLHDLAVHIAVDHVLTLDARSGFACAWRACPQNATALPSRHELVDHLRSHTGNRSYLCPADGCDKVYKRSDFLARHVATHAEPANGAARAPTPAKRKARREPEDTATDSDASMYSSHDEARARSRPCPPALPADALESDAQAALLQAQLAYIRDQVSARQRALARYRAKTRRLRLENDILIDALSQT